MNKRIYTRRRSVARVEHVAAMHLFMGRDDMAQALMDFFADDIDETRIHDTVKQYRGAEARMNAGKVWYND